jgi:lipoprotein-anchoring transpeptidase ErfK/SrfK
MKRSKAGQLQLTRRELGKVGLALPLILLPKPTSALQATEPAVIDADEPLGLDPEGLVVSQAQQVPVRYSFAQARIPAYTRASTSASEAHYYGRGRLIRHAPEVINGCVMVVYDSSDSQQRPVYVPADFLLELTEDQVQPEPKQGLELIVYRSQYRLDLVENGVVIAQFPVSTGKPGHETPLGENFHILGKRWARDMRGSYIAPDGTEDKWKVRGVPFTMYFTEYGHAIHGAPWNKQLGTANLSHGCVNMNNEAAREIFLSTYPVLPTLQQEVVWGSGTRVRVRA